MNSGVKFNLIISPLKRILIFPFVQAKLSIQPYVYKDYEDILVRWKKRPISAKLSSQNISLGL